LVKGKLAPNVTKTKGAFPFVMTPCYNLPMKCIECKELLDIFPIYNDGKDEDFPPYMLMCNNKECSRFGLLTVVFKSEKTEEKSDEQDEHKTV
jgi:hypothetical protein